MTDRRRVACLCAFVAWLAPAAARAQVGEEARTRAREIFDEGRRLLAAGRIAEACGKFETAEQMAPAMGKRLTLADCYEKLGKTATAWQLFGRVAGEAEQAHDELRVRTARERMAALEPKLSRLTLRLSAEADVPGLQIERDGVPVQRGSLGIAVPVDPGDHLVAVTAPGRSEGSQKIAVTSGASVVVELPAPRLKPQPPPPPRETAPQEPGKGRLLAVWVVGGAGIAAIGGSLVLGILAKSAYDDANDTYCGGRLMCPTQDGIDAVNDAKDRAVVATVVFGVGVAAVTTAVILHLTTPKATRLAPGAAIAPGLVGLTLDGEF